MHGIFRKIAIAALPAILMAAVAPAQASRADRLATFEKFAGAPVAEFHYFQLTGFETLADHTVAVWVGPNKVYLIKVREPCSDFNYANAISLSGSPTNIFTQKFGTVRFGNDRCMVESIRPVDYHAMRRYRSAKRNGTPESD